ncbi:MAG: hypothetical protein FWD55_06375, partial [Propionibacteriaceae bacterium]|nr:hypothetical protein [Propionibacteriaceae bacterium]
HLVAATCRGNDALGGPESAVGAVGQVSGAVVVERPDRGAGEELDLTGEVMRYPKQLQGRGEAEHRIWRDGKGHVERVSDHACKASRLRHVHPTPNLVHAPADDRAAQQVAVGLAAGELRGEVLGGEHLPRSQELLDRHQVTSCVE